MRVCVWRLDADQAARGNAQKYFNIVDPDFYEFEGQISQLLQLQTR